MTKGKDIQETYMIFVTVGTHEQPFNRLIECVDKLRKSQIIREDVIIQKGYSDYKAECCEAKDFYTQKEMMDNYREARIIIMHGGPSSMIESLREGKIPIVVPRMKSYGEHINDHQIDFCRAVNSRYNNIILVEDIKELENAIVNYDELAGSRLKDGFSNNARFCEGFSRIVEGL
jgi:UDP-N-acetylglucosamine transferase subunit ALG13